MTAHPGRRAPRTQEQDPVDEASAESMVASDPPAFTGMTGVGGPSRDRERRQEIRRRAYELWLNAGRPGDRDREFLAEAERELDEGR
jgi:hypothetical protein